MGEKEAEAERVPPTLRPPTYQPRPATYTGSDVQTMDTGVIPRPATAVTPDMEELANYRMLAPPSEVMGSDLMASGASSQPLIPMAEGTFLRATPSRATMAHEFFQSRMDDALPRLPIQQEGVLDRIFRNMANRFTDFQNNRAQQALEAERMRLRGAVMREPVPMGEATAQRNFARQFRNADPEVQQRYIEMGRIPERGARPFGEMTESTAPTVQRPSTVSMETAQSGRSLSTAMTGESTATREMMADREARVQQAMGRVRRGGRRFEDGYDTTATSEASIPSAVSSRTARRLLGTDYQGSSRAIQPSTYVRAPAQVSQVESMGQEMATIPQGIGGEATSALEGAVSAETEATAGLTFASEATTALEAVAL